MSSTEQAHEQPWTLTVQLSDDEYQEAMEYTENVLFNRPWPGGGAGEGLGIGFDPDAQTITLGGVTRERLIGPMAFYVGGWSSAQITLRPSRTDGGEAS